MEQRENQTSFTEVNDYSMIYSHQTKLDDKNKLKVIKRDKSVMLNDPTVFYRHYHKFTSNQSNIGPRSYHNYIMERRNVKSEENIYIQVKN